MSVLIARRNTISYKSLLPPTYRRVEYLERSLTYIGPFIEPNYTVNVGEIITTYTKPTSGYDYNERAFCRAYGENGNFDTRVELYYKTNAVPKWWSADGHTGTGTEGATYDTMSIQAWRSLYIERFGVYNDTSDFSLGCRLFGLKITDSNNAVLHDLKPCVRVSDDVPGFYDIVDGVFFSNAGNSGAFVPGGTIYE